MEALFQIGKEFGELRARVEKLESQKSGCKDCGKGVSEAELSATQRRTVAFLRENYSKIVEAFNKTLAEFGVQAAAQDKLLVSSFKLTPAALVNPQWIPGVCCMCCNDGSYCCNDKNCAGCC